MFLEQELILFYEYSENSIKWLNQPTGYE